MNNKVEQISSLFGSKTRYKILKLYAENGDAKFFVREITRLIDEQINSVRRELENLEKIGLLVSKDKNNKRYFFINSKSNIYSGLCMIMGHKKMTKTSTSRVRSASIAEFAEISELKLICSELLTKPEDNKQMPVDIFCVVDSPKAKIEALRLLKRIEDSLDYDINYSTLTKDEYQLGAKLNPELYGTIYRVGIKLI
jgi:predicted transcriptional regulator